MNPLLLTFVGAIVRWLLTSLSGYFVAHHILTTDQSDAFSRDLFTHIMLILPGAAALLWSLIAKMKTREKFLAALDLPAGSSEQKVDDYVKQVKTFGGTLGVMVLLVVLYPLPASAQPSALDPPLAPSNPTVQRIADVASWATVAAAIAVDTKASFDSRDRKRAFASQGLRAGATYLAAEVIKRYVDRSRPCAPDCGRDDPHASFPSEHTMFAAQTLRTTRLSISLPLAVSTAGLRIAANKHYLTDTLVGFALGAAIGQIR